ncbi:hypothetical protein, partial [Tahibacter caeni]|uniref:hypothetical protein n=1 Tax=Tahibacter caeni TaxID=1453545 RepID=UPI002147E9CA
MLSFTFPLVAAATLVSFFARLPVFSRGRAGASSLRGVVAAVRSTVLTASAGGDAAAGGAEAAATAAGGSAGG